MTTGSSLIRGGTALFGAKAKLQFGKLTLTGLISQQNSESQTVTTQGGVQSTKFSVKADNYDANRHFSLPSISMTITTVLLPDSLMCVFGHKHNTHRGLGNQQAGQLQ